MSTAYHPETDGQSESSVKAFKQYLRKFVNYAQDNWVDFLPDAEFMVNTHISASTGVSPFFADNGFHPRTGLEPKSQEDSQPAEVTRADRLLERHNAMREYLQEQLCWIQEEQERHANKLRQPHLAFKLGDKVFVDARHFNLNRETKSLGPKSMGPYEIIRVVDNKAYEIALLEHMQNKGLFNVFHPWKLHLAPDNPYPGQVQEPGPAIMIWDDDDEAPHEEWEVLEIVGHGGSAKNRSYRATYTPGWDDWNAAPPL